MGYPMTWNRIVSRNQLEGDYGDNFNPKFAASYRGMIAGDMRRLEKDTRDEAHIKMYARYSGATEEQVKKIFDAFFDNYYEIYTPEIIT